MGDLSFLVIAYGIVWLALLGYLGWIALRMRGVHTELETVRELVEERDRPSSTAPSRE
ncbi:MAG TPA: CcmD family protein [Ktedonobacterales bacterium]|nr:CcmD family protein [Ktedonobacterales bacterium]